MWEKSVTSYTDVTFRIQQKYGMLINSLSNSSQSVNVEISQ